MADRFDIFCSTAYFRCIRGDNSVNDRRLATGTDYQTPIVDAGLHRLSHCLNVSEILLNSNNDIAHTISVLSEPELGFSSTQAFDVLSSSVLVLASSFSALNGFAAAENITLSILQYAGKQIEPSVIEGILGNHILPIELQELHLNDSNSHLHLPISVIQMSFDRMHRIHLNEIYDKGVTEYKTLTNRGTIRGTHKFSIPPNTKLYFIFTSYGEKFKAGVFERVKKKKIVLYLMDMK